MPFAVFGLVEWMYTRINDLLGWLVSLGFSGKLKWVARDWVAFVVGIILFGVAVDLLVYIVRYRPDRKWREWLRRLGTGRAENAGGQRGEPPRRTPERRGGETSAPTQPRAEEPETVLQGRKMPPTPPAQARTVATASRERAATPGAQTRETAPPRQPVRQKTGLSSAEMFQPAPPMEEYDGEPNTYQPAKRTPEWKRPVE